jgi:hypothetical protein
MLAFALAFYEEFEDADNPARQVLQSRVLVIDSATLPPEARLAVASSERRARCSP